MQMRNTNKAMPKRNGTWPATQSYQRDAFKFWPVSAVFGLPNFRLKYFNKILFFLSWQRPILMLALKSKMNRPIGWWVRERPRNILPRRRRGTQKLSGKRAELGRRSEKCVYARRRCNLPRWLGRGISQVINGGTKLKREFCASFLMLNFNNFYNIH